MDGIMTETKIVKTRHVYYGQLSEEHKKIYEEAAEYVSDKHPVRCVCGKLCTGLHERTCPRFRSAVEKEFFKRADKYEEQLKNVRVSV